MKFEYKQESRYTAESLIRSCNIHTINGWEVISVYHDGTSHVAFLKRKITTTRKTKSNDK